MEERQGQGAHKIALHDRKGGMISGVSDVLSFDLNEIVLDTVQGMLMVRGQELHMKRLTLEKGEVEIEGEIDSLVYSDHGPDGRKGESLLGRLFR